MIRPLVFAALVCLTCACSKKDMTGRELTDVEATAFDTCNHDLVSKFRNTLGTVNSTEAVFLTKPDQIDIAWDARTTAGKGMIVCSTSGSGNYVKGWLVDGIQVRP